MPHHDHITVKGRITDVFAHRFVVETEQGRILADLTPKGAEQVALKAGDGVTLSGEMKPSELKVERFTLDGGETITVEHKKPHEQDGHVNPGPALKGAEASGYRVLGKPRRKPKHFEILGRNSQGELHELHIELSGHLRKTKPVSADDPKWTADINPAF